MPLNCATFENLLLGVSCRPTRTTKLRRHEPDVGIARSVQLELSTIRCTHLLRTRVVALIDKCPLHSTLVYHPSANGFYGDVLGTLLLLLLLLLVVSPTQWRVCITQRGTRSLFVRGSMGRVSGCLQVADDVFFLYRTRYVRCSSRPVSSSSSAPSSAQHRCNRPSAAVEGVKRQACCPV